jgi:hypothetical protein
MKQILTGIGGLILIIGTCWGVFTYLERYALCEDVKKVEQRLEQKIQFDRMSDTKRMMYEIIRENKDKAFEKWPVKDQKLYQELELQLEETQGELKKKK